MKRIGLVIVFMSALITTQAQEAEGKKVQAGLVFGAGMNFQKMGTKYIASNGVGSDFTIGANMNYAFNDNLGLNFGVEFDFETLKYKMGSEQLYYAYNDTDIIPYNDYNTSQDIFQMLERKQKPIYLTVPTMLLFRTKFIGYFRYFGKFGLRTSVLLGNKITDEGYHITSATPFELTENENMTAKSEMFFLKSAVGLAGGAEWNFVGSTCLVAELGYYYGFVPLYYSKDFDKRYMRTFSGENIDNSARQSQLMLKISVLF